jgi:choline dehydrogenase-like flavoprotein
MVAGEKDSLLAKEDKRGYSSSSLKPPAAEGQCHSVVLSSLGPDTQEHDEMITVSSPKLRMLSVAAGFLLVTTLLLALLPHQRLLLLATTNDDTSTQYGDSATLFYYDYIIVGAGPSGIIAATELAKSFPKLQILLIEAGTMSQSSVQRNLRERGQQPKDRVCDETSPSVLPLPAQLNAFDVPLLWSGIASSAHGILPPSTEPHNIRHNHKHHWPIRRTLLGKTMGGSGLHNAMIYIRSLSTDWKRWNVTGWNIADILKEYERLEWYDKVDHASSYRGKDGPIVTTSAKDAPMDAIASLFVESAVAAGYSERESFNNPEPADRIGVGYYEFNIRNGIRDSAAKAFLGQESLDEHDNLHIETGITVTRVILSLPKEDIPHSRRLPQAIGVEYVRTTSTRHNNRVGQFLLRESGEVILAAGAIMTPQLLANSGIGDPLKEDGNKTNGIRVDLPGVGKNLRDHPVVLMAFEIDAAIALAGAASSIYTIGNEMLEYIYSALALERSHRNHSETAGMRTPLGTLGTAGFSAGGFMRSPWAEDDAPDIQLTVFPRHMEPHIAQQTRKRKPTDQWLLRNKAMLISVALLNPEGRYEVKPSSSFMPFVTFDPEVDIEEMEEASNRDDEEAHTLRRVLGYKLPVIDLPDGDEKYLTDLDIKRLAWGMEQVRRIQSTAPLCNCTGPELYPGASVRGKALHGYIREENLPNSHWAGSTSMPSASGDPSKAVVDEHLRVRKVKLLRIIDSGVLPSAPNGNIHATVCAVASRGSALIANDRSEQH